MADAPVPAAVADPVAPTTEGEAPKESGDILDIVLEGMDKPVKVPVSKIPLDKLQPHLGKLRAEADRRMSEADLRSKDLDARAARYEAIDKLAARVKEDPDTLFKLAKELGLDEDMLGEMSERQVAQRIRNQLRDEDEKADPSKKTAREEREELQRLREERKQFDEERQQRQTQQFKDQSERFIVEALEKTGLSGNLKLDAAREMVPILRAAILACKADDLSDFALTHDELAKAAQDALRQRHDWYKDFEASRKPADPTKVEQAKHPAEGGTPRPKPKPAGGPKNGVPAATHFLRELLK